MQIPDEVSRSIIDHNAFVECVELEEAILPTLGFASQVVGVKTSEFDDRGGVLGRGESQVRGERSCGR